ncbi:MAG TPA: SRPBCC family protein [Gaiellales bacterium]|nr:SRPBCC family protein [Gaiellales bacterium]
MRVRTTTRIDSSPEQVFDTLADVRNDVRWNSRVSKAELESSEPVGLGSQFRMVNGGARYDVTLTTHERPSRLVLEARGKPEVTIAYTVAPVDGGGTDLHSDFDFRPAGGQKVLFALVGPLIRREIPKQFAGLKAYCERGDETS